MILRLPERFLPPFLKAMKQDFLRKKPYLKFLRINSKFIHICSCDHKICHAYCCTAQVLRSQKIYCKDCLSYFSLYVRSERIFSSEYLGGVIRLLLVFAMFSSLIYAVFYLDRFLKGELFLE